MSCETEFSIAAPDEVIAALRSEYEDARDAFDEEGYCAGELIWHSWDRDIATISARYPDALIIVEGYGHHGRDDWWTAYFKGGKMQMEEVRPTFGDFSEQKLQPVEGVS